MAMNKVQFQKGLSLDGFHKKYDSEAQCEEALVAARWPHGYQCPRCTCKRVADDPQWQTTLGMSGLWLSMLCDCRHDHGGNEITVTEMVSVDVLDHQSKNPISSL